MTVFRTLDVDDSEVFYRQAGDPTHQAVLLLHGFPSSSAQYQELIDALADRYRLIAPDLPGFGRSAPLEGTSTFDRLADTIERFTELMDLGRYTLYLFDFGAPVGFRLATRHPARVQGLIIQNGNAYEAGIGPNLAGLAPYWQDRVAHEAAVRQFLTLESTRAQYLEGVPDPEQVRPDLYELDQRYQDLRGRDQVMLDLIYDYTSNLALYPTWQAYLREHQPPALIAWGKNDNYFTADGARAYLTDLPNAQLHLLDTGHFATATHSRQLAALINAHLSAYVTAEPSAGPVAAS